jgi:hypothetical protein
MTHTTMAAWENNIAIQLATAIPTLLVTDGIVLADNYLSANGGWLPDNPGAPTDLGVPASGLTDAAILALLISNITNGQYEFTATILVPLTFTIYANLAPGLGAASVRDACIAQIHAYLARIAAPLPIGLNTSSLTYTQFASSVVGTLTSTQLNTYQAGIGTLPQPIMSTVLQQARTRFGLDQTWNFFSIFTSADNGTTAILQKYTDQSYSVLDSTNTDQVVVGIDTDNGTVITGIMT